MAENENEYELSFEKLLKVTNAQFTFTVNGKDPVVGFLTDDLSFNAGSNWGDVGGTLDSVNKAIDTVLSIGNMVNLWSQRSFRVENIASTMQTWEGSQPFTIDISLVFVTIRKKHTKSMFNVLKNVRHLMGACFGEFEQPTLAVFPSKVMAPMGYMRGKSGAPVGTWNISVGKWFKTGPVMLLENCNFTVSKQTTPEGVPLFATGGASFKACQMLSAGQITDMFLEVGGQ